MKAMFRELDGDDFQVREFSDSIKIYPGGGVEIASVSIVEGDLIVLTTAPIDVADSPVSDDTFVLRHVEQIPVSIACGCDTCNAFKFG